MEQEELLREPFPEPPTEFLTGQRATVDELRQSIETASTNPVISVLLGVFGGIVAVLNRHRQIIAVNEGMLRLIDAEDASGVLGLRQGEVLDCQHAHDQPGGCGTSRFCSTCGAAIAVVLAQRSGTPQERECLLTMNGEGAESIELKRCQALERVFLHDLKNTMVGMQGYTELVKRLGVLTNRIVDEV